MKAPPQSAPILTNTSAGDVGSARNGLIQSENGLVILRKYDAECKKCRVCFSSDDIHAHARDNYHTKCFVADCGHGSDGDIQEHV
jgi:hypothetical protein